MIPKRIQPAQKMEAATIRGWCRGIPVLAALVALAVSLCIVPVAARAQDSKLAEGPPPPPPEESSSPAPAPVDPASHGPARPDEESSSQPTPAPVDPASSGPAKPDEESSSQPVPLPTSHAGGFPGERPTIRLRPDSGGPAAPAEPAQPVLDPVGASRSLDVGTFYLKKGDYDAAIDRFQEAAQRQPKLAKPYLLMGEAYEKKNDPASAVTAYRKYLQLFPKAPDQDKVNKRIEKLTDVESKRDTSPR